MSHHHTESYKRTVLFLEGKFKELGVSNYASWELVIIFLFYNFISLYTAISPKHENFVSKASNHFNDSMWYDFDV